MKLAKVGLVAITLLLGTAGGCICTSTPDRASQLKDCITSCDLNLMTCKSTCREDALCARTCAEGNLTCIRTCERQADNMVSTPPR